MCLIKSRIHVDLSHSMKSLIVQEEIIKHSQRKLFDIELGHEERHCQGKSVHLTAAAAAQLSAYLSGSLMRYTYVNTMPQSHEMHFGDKIVAKSIFNLELSFGIHSIT